jgi:hypothetical protein
VNPLELARIRPDRRTGRVSSWDTSGRNADAWTIAPGERRVLAEIDGPGCITHIWMTQQHHYRECLLLITWDNAAEPSVEVPLGDFFCLGHGMVRSFQSALFTASTAHDERFALGCALNCHVQMPFQHRARIELLNESAEPHAQYFYVDYERFGAWPGDLGYFHAEFRRANPFPGWAPDFPVYSEVNDVANLGEEAWNNNYVILDTAGEGHYIGCNLSITNVKGEWWGEGDDMIWIDGYTWPPDLHGTGSEDYLGQAWETQDNAFLRNGVTLDEHANGGYQTSYVLHLENAVRFSKSLRVTIEHGHANHLGNDMASVAYWYARTPTAAATPPPVAQRLPVPRDEAGNWVLDAVEPTPSTPVTMTEEMAALRRRHDGDERS